MIRLSVAIDSTLLDEAQRLSGARTRREALEIALRAYVERRTQHDLASLAGSELVNMDLADLQHWRQQGDKRAFE